MWINDQGASLVGNKVTEVSTVTDQNRYTPKFVSAKPLEKSGATPKSNDTRATSVTALPNQEAADAFRMAVSDIRAHLIPGFEETLSESKLAEWQYISGLPTNNASEVGRWRARMIAFIVENETRARQ